MNTIGIIGLAHSGKSTVAKTLASMGYVELSFAKKLKDTASIAFDLPRDMLEGDTVESREWREKPLAHWNGMTPRQLLVALATSMREINPEVFINSVRNDMADFGPANYVISDVRFNNEFKFLNESCGAVFIEVERNKPEWAKLTNNAKTEHKGIEMAVGVHSGEYSMQSSYIHNQIDYRIMNDTGVSMDQLEGLIHYTLEDIELNDL